MRYLYCENIADAKALVLIDHCGDGLTEVEKNTWIKVEEVPPFPSSMFGKVAELYINPQTKEMWHEFKDRPLTLEEETILLKEEVAMLWYELMIGGM